MSATEGRVHLEVAGDLVEVHFSGKLTALAYEEFVPVLEERLRAHGKLRMLLVLRDFDGWTAGALWEDLKFDLAHFRDVFRLAVVGEKTWHKAMAWFIEPFTTAEVRYYELDGIDAARAWLSGGDGPQ